MQHFIGYCFSGAGPDIYANHGPIVIESQLEKDYQWDFLYPEKQDTIDNVIQLNQKLCQLTHLYLSSGAACIVVSADHSSAFGTWSGASLFQKGPIGMIWIDSHLNYEINQTKNCAYNMPVANLMGFGDKRLTEIGGKGQKIDPRYFVYVGVRDDKENEVQLVKDNNIKVFTADEVNSRGIDLVMREAIEVAEQCPFGYGVSLNINVFDPLQMPGVSTPSYGGIDFGSFLKFWQSNQLAPIAVEITEFNPNNDISGQTLNHVVQLIENWSS